MCLMGWDDKLTQMFTQLVTLSQLYHQLQWNLYAVLHDTVWYVGMVQLPVLLNESPVTPVMMMSTHEICIVPCFKSKSFDIEMNRYAMHNSTFVWCSLSFFTRFCSCKHVSHGV